MHLSVLLAGTSNSVLNQGFSWAFEHHSSIKFVNASLGSSCSANAAWVVATKDIENFDFVIIDLTNNDEHQYTHGHTSVDRVLNSIFTLVEMCAEKNVIPVVVSFPRVLYFEAKRPIHDAVLSACRRLGIATFDMYSVIERAFRCSVYPVAIDTYFMDEAHLKPVISRFLGYKLITILNEIKASGKVSSENVAQSFRRIIYNDFSNIAGSEGLVRESRIVAQKFSLLLLDRMYVSPINTAGDIVALHSNAAESCAGIYIDGKRAMGPNPESLGEKRWKLLSVIRPLPNPISASESVGIHIDDEKSLGEECKYEIAGIVVQSNTITEALKVSSTPLSNMEISNRFSFDILNELNVIAAG
ncbi:hypothetical protein [Roseobacter sp. N2S]|uniref:hypothetical protein n=1 Tax=Roseobacter sp. N2S TaxID=2663844 RepID=UPI002866C7CB|nr:hypothetical protein [Roseobacter sp. N2S]MDR6267578.1 hypothetical protein [Roseobacter sp. N2S]